VTPPRRVKRLDLHTTQGESGALLRESQFVVRYTDDALGHPELAISLTMPPRPEGWRSNELPPVLAMNLPEGFLLGRVVERYRKVMDIEDMNLLALTSTPTAGRLWASQPGSGEDVAQRQPIALRDILAHPGTEDLFEELLERYGTASISGVQPKVVVPERSTMRAGRGLERSSIRAPDLIVKSAGAEYPGLPENEYLCMSIARHVGLEVPDFWLSEDRKLFVIRRFDLGPSGYLGFEDLAALTGRHPTRKYEGSYADVARAIGDFAAPIMRNASLDAFFRLLVLNCVIRNGDAHLKNFGILYGDPAGAARDARLSPIYDLVCTTAFIPRDAMALNLHGTKAWPDGRALERFGREACGVTNPALVVAEVGEKALDYRPEEPRSAMWGRIRAQMEAAARTMQAPARRSPTARPRAPRR
jgi:serine/threonine-protein kinase HipA